VARLADPDPWRDHIRSTAAWTDRGRLTRLTREAPARLAREARAGGVPSRFVGVLGLRLHALGGDAEGLLRAAQARRPGDFWLNFVLGKTLSDKNRLGETIAFYRAAVAVRPEAAVVHNNLGNALRNQGRLAEAVAELHRATVLDPKFAIAHDNLGLALKSLGQRGEAVAEFRRAMALDPKDAVAHANLGQALYEQGQFPAAMAEYRRAIALQPKFARPYSELGNVLAIQGRFPEAIEKQRRAIALDPRYAMAHTNLGLALYEQGQLPAAVAEHRRAVALDPRLAPAHYNLGLALSAQGDHAGAIAAYRRAVRLNPNLAEVYCHLGLALRQLGRWDESLECYREGHRLGVRRKGWPYPSGRWLKEAQLLADLDKQLFGFFQGGRKPADVGECLALAELCRHRRCYAAAARFSAEALDRQSQLAVEPAAGQRYDAACFAALAGSGQGEDAAGLDGKKQARLRGQALEWLRADLTLWKQRLAGAKPAERQAARPKLRHWQTDPDLAGVRDSSALAKLPTEEAQAWHKLWEEVARLLAYARPSN
jgi:tetratricopeptide (TPR) repeat protein